MANVAEYPLRTAANERARNAFYKVNQTDDDLLRSLYPNGCTLAEAIEFFEKIAEFEKSGATATTGRQYIAITKTNC